MNIRNMIAALLVVAAGLGANTARSSFADGNDLVKWCGTDDNVCIAYVMGVSDTFGHIHHDRYDEFCVPDRATGRQLKMVTTQWLDANPHLLHNPADYLVTNALIDGFGCENGLRYILD